MAAVTLPKVIVQKDFMKTKGGNSHFEKSCFLAEVEGITGAFLK